MKLLCLVQPRQRLNGVSPGWLALGAIGLLYFFTSSGDSGDAAGAALDAAMKANTTLATLHLDGELSDAAAELSFSFVGVSW